MSRSSSSRSGSERSEESDAGPRRRRSHLHAIALGEVPDAPSPMPVAPLPAPADKPITIPPLSLGLNPTTVAVIAGNVLRVGSLALGAYAVYSFAKKRRGRAAWLGGGAGVAWVASRFAADLINRLWRAPS